MDCELSDKITLLNEVPSHSDVANIINACNCGLFPTRAEGWNMEGLEALACGKSLITTNYSGHTEYCTKENAFLVEPDEIEKAYDSKWFFGQGSWMELEYDQEEAFIEHMRHCFKERPSNLTEGLATAKKFSWRNTVDTLLTVTLDG